MVVTDFGQFSANFASLFGIEVDGNFVGPGIKTEKNRLTFFMISRV
ncbi:hypothetical protein GGR92_004236 [Spirosoma lacussanchae]